MRVEPCELFERISLTPAIVPSARSSGVATVDAIVSGLAPGRLALDRRSPGSRSAAAARPRSSVKADRAASTIDRFSSVVATGRLMKGEERLMRVRVRSCHRSASERRLRDTAARGRADRRTGR